MNHKFRRRFHETKTNRERAYLIIRLGPKKKHFYRIVITLLPMCGIVVPTCKGTKITSETMKNEFNWEYLLVLFILRVRAIRRFLKKKNNTRINDRLIT